MYPSVIDSFNYPQASDRLNNPSHSALENSQSSVIGQIEAVLGLSGDGPGTIIGDLRSASSGGGGHIQTPTFGGTGQTSFTKGDLLVATSSSVLAKLGVSSTYGDALISDPTQSAGMKWQPATASKIVFSSSVTSYARSVFSAQDNVLFATSIVGGVLGASNAVRFTGTISTFNQNSGDSYTFKLNYGNNMVASVVILAKATLTNASSIESGLIEGVLGGANTVTSQLGYIKISTGFSYINNGAATFTQGLGHGNSSINSLLDQDLIITGTASSNSANSSIATGLFLVEKIA